MTRIGQVVPLAAFLAAVLLITAFGGGDSSAQVVSPSSTTLDDRIVLIGESNGTVRDIIKANVDVDQIFQILETNTESCSSDCEAIYIFKNPVNKPLPISRKGIRFYDADRKNQLPAGSVNLTSVDFYDITTRTRLTGLTEIPGNGKVAVRIRGSKSPDIETDWVPFICIDGSDFPAVSYGVSEVCMYQTEWALWGMVDTSSGIDTSPVVYYDFDIGAFPSDDAIDKSGNGNDGTVTGAENDTGIRNNAIIFDGNGDYVDTGSNLGITDGDFSVSLWYKPRNLAGSAEWLVSNRNAGAHFSVYIDGGSDEFRIFANDGVSGSVFTSAGNLQVTDDTWFYGVAVREGDTLKSYLNGVFINSTTYVGLGNLWDSSSNVNLGWRQTGATYANGTMDDLRIYNFALTDKQILGLYEMNSETIRVYSPLNTSYHNVSAVPLNLSIEVGVPGNISVAWVLDNVTYLDVNTTLFLDFEEYNDTAFGGVVDHSNYENTGYNVGGTNVSGRYGAGLEFDGINDYFDTEYSFSADNIFTVCDWINMTSNPDNTQIWMVDDTTTSTNINMKVFDSTGFPRLFIRDSTNSDDVAIEAHIDFRNAGWKFLCGTYDGTDGNIYVDGLLMNSSAATFTGSFEDDTGMYLGKLVQSDGDYLNGTLDNHLVSSRALSASEVKNIYQTDLRWKNDSWWTLEGSLDLNVSGFIDDGDTVNLTIAGCNTAGFCISEQADITIQSETLAVTFDNQNPPDVGVLTFFSTLVNVTYNISSPYGITGNTSWSSVNTSSGCYEWLNGTCMLEGNESNVYESYQDLGDDQYLYIFGEHGALPWTGNLDHEIMEDTDHTSTRSFAGANTAVLVRLYDVKNNTKQGFFESMVTPNSGVLSVPLEFWYCNDQYVLGGTKFFNSPNCVSFATIDPSTDSWVNHSHSIYENHSLVSFPVNPTTGEINGIPVTNTSYFIFRADGVLGWTIYGVPLQTRGGQMQRTTNGGSGWTVEDGLTWDAHLHQYDGSEAWCKFTEGFDGNGDALNSTEICDLLDLAGLPPSAPGVLVPDNFRYGWDDPAFDINHTIATSPNAYPISYYNRSLFDDAFDFLMVLNDTTSETEVYYDVSRTLLGQYHVGVRATDDQDQTGSWGFSELFNVTSCVPIDGLNWTLNRTESCTVIDETATVDIVTFIESGHIWIEDSNIVLNDAEDFFNVSFGGTTCDWSEVVS